jgi:hypothetical protein
MLAGHPQDDDVTMLVMHVPAGGPDAAGGPVAVAAADGAPAGPQRGHR